MGVSGIAALFAAGVQAAQQPLQSAQSSPSQRKFGHAHSMSDVDAQSASVASAANPTGSVGSKLNITA